MLLLAATLAACSTAEKRDALHQNPSIEPSLEMPPGLDLKEGDNVLEVPELSAAPEKAPAPAPAASPAAAPVFTSGWPWGQGGAPDAGFVALERDGAVRWLLIQAPPQQVWERTHEYWNKYGPALKEAQSELMIMDTEWVELDSGEERSLFKKAFGALFADTTRDKFRIRLEAGAASGTTELYLSHQRMEQQAVNDSIRWLPAQASRELEAEMLKRLVVFFGLPQARADAILSPVSQVDYRIVSHEGGPQLEIGAGKEWAWRRLRLAVDRSGMEIRSVDEADGSISALYTLVSRVEEEGFVRRVKEIKERVELALVLTESAGVSRVAVMAAAGPMASDKAEEVLEDLLDRMD